MKVLKKNVKFYTNQEIKNILENEFNKFTEEVKSFCGDTKAVDNLRGLLKGKGLAEFEIIQLMNINPKQILDLQLIIEEMEERYTEADCNEILKMFD
jgi:DNA-directed RNA polymerase subunit F